MQNGSLWRWHWQRPDGELGIPPREVGRGRARASARSPEPSSDALDPEDAAVDARKPPRVYIVEDSPIAREWLAYKIEKAGGELIGSSDDAEAAISDVFALQPDLILIDIRLASGSGFDVLKALQIHSLAPAAVKVVLTHYADPEYRNRSASLGADRFFDKSSQTAQALELLDTVAAERRNRRSRLR